MVGPLLLVLLYASPSIVLLAGNPPSMDLLIFITCALFVIAIMLAFTSSDVLRGTYSRLSRWMNLQAYPRYGLRHLVGSAFSAMLAFAGLYQILSLSDPLAFNKRLDPITSAYFSIITFATVGYGDFYATAWLSQLVVMAEVLFSMAYFVFLFSLLAGFLCKK
jgi:hypothetical protein